MGIGPPSHPTDFFFQAEDGIRDRNVTGVQTCALPIWALAKEIGPSGVSVNAVSPGFIDTKMNKHLQNEEKESIISSIPLNRAGLASDVSHTVSFLMDEKSSYIQGEIVHITGGW